MLRATVANLFGRSNGGAPAGGDPSAAMHERTVAAAMANVAASRGINLNELLESIGRGGAQASGSVIILKELMDSVPSAVRAPRELDAAALARRKAELAQRDYFTSQATESADSLEATLPAHVGLWGAIPRAFLIERAAHNRRVDYVTDIHDSIWGLRSLANWMLLIGLAGIGLMIAAREIEFAFGVDVKSGTVLILRILNSVTTLALLVVLTMYHSLEHHFESRDKGYLIDLGRWPWSRLSIYLVEFAICVIHDVPLALFGLEMSLDSSQLGFLASATGVSQIDPVYLAQPWSLLMFLRVYLFARVMVGRTFSGGASVIGMFANFPFDSFFGIRAIIETDALVTLGKAIIVLIFCMAYCLHVCERAFAFDAGTWNQSFTGAVWMSFLTAATIGYGDTYPLTIGGRVVMLLNACIGLCILSGLVGAFNSMISMEPWEMKFVETTADSVNRRRRRNAASSVIAMAWRMRNARREMRITAAKLGLPSADADGARGESSRDEAASGTLASSVSRFRTTAKSTFVFTSPARRKPAPPPPPPRAAALPARLNLTRYQWLALFVDLQQQRVQYEFMSRRLVLKMEECSTYRKLVKDAAQRAPSVDFLRLRLMRIRHQCSLIADKLMGSQRPQTYQSNPIVSAMVKLFKGDIASKLAQDRADFGIVESDEDSDTEDAQRRAEIEKMKQNMADREAEIAAIRSGENMLEWHKKRAESRRPPTVNETRLNDIKDQRRMQLALITRRAAAAAAAASGTLQRPRSRAGTLMAASAKITAHPNYHPLMGAKHMWPTIWPRLPTTNIEAHIARFTAQREVKARLARERAEAEAEQRAVAAAREAKRVRMMAKIAMEESLLPAFFHTSGLVAWFSSLFAKSESASSSPSSSSSSSPSSSSSSSLDSTPRRAAVSTTIALLGLPADFVFSDRRRSLKPVNPLPFVPTERPRTFATQHMQEVAEVVADASDEAKAERRRLREAQLARLRNDWRNRVHHHHHHMHHHLIAPQGETGVRSGAGGARGAGGASAASRPHRPTPPGIIYMEGWVDDFEQCITKLLVQAQSITQEMAEFAVRLHQIDIEIGVTVKAIDDKHGL